MSHNECGCGHDHSKDDAQSTSSSNQHEGQESPAAPIVAKASVAVSSFMNGMAQLISAFEEITGGKVATNLTLTLTHEQQPELPKGRIGLFKAAYVRNMRNWHPEDVDKSEEERRVVEAPAMCRVFDISPTLLSFLPDSPETIIQHIPLNIAEYPQNPGGQFIVLNGTAVYMEHVSNLIQTMGVSGDRSDLTSEQAEAISKSIGVPLPNNLTD